MSLIARAPSNLSSSASESSGKKSYESQSPWSAKAEKEDGTGQPVVGSDPRTAPDHKHFVESLYSACYSWWDDDKAWYSQEWKADELMDDRRVKPVVAPWAKTNELQSSFSHEKEDQARYFGRRRNS